MLYQVYVDNMQIFRLKFNAVPELQAFKVTWYSFMQIEDGHPETFPQIGSFQLE